MAPLKELKSKRRHDSKEAKISSRQLRSVRRGITAAAAANSPQSRRPRTGTLHLTIERSLCHQKTAGGVPQSVQKRCWRLQSGAVEGAKGNYCEQQVQRGKGVDGNEALPRHCAHLYPCCCRGKKVFSFILIHSTNWSLFGLKRRKKPKWLFLLVVFFVRFCSFVNFS